MKERDITTCNVILDFKEKKVVKSVIQGQSMNLTWDALIEYYNKVYPDQIAELQKINAE